MSDLGRMKMNSLSEGLHFRFRSAHPPSHVVYEASPIPAESFPVVQQLIALFQRLPEVSGQIRNLQPEAMGGTAPSWAS